MSEGLKFKLVVVGGPRRGLSFVLQDGDQLMGRGEDCAIRFPGDPLISREHMRLHVADGELMAHDLGSTHGSLLNGKALRGGASAVVGDQLQVGSSLLKVEQASEGEENVTEVAADVEPVSELPEVDSTGHLHPDDSPKTQVHVGFGATEVAAEDSDVKSYENQETRMLKPEELAGLRSAAAKPKRSVSKSPVVGLLIVGLLVAGTLAFFKMEKDDEGQLSLAGIREVRDEQFRTEIKVPFSWEREDSSLPIVADFRLLNDAGQEAGQLVWHALRERSFETIGIEKGFEQLESEIAIRHPGYEQIKMKQGKVNKIDVVEYLFTSDERKGRGLFFFNKDRRIWIEGSATSLTYPQWADEIGEAVRSVKLDSAQVYLKYPKPSLEIKRAALQDPKAVVDEAKYYLRQAKELISRRSMRPENLYRSIELLQKCLQNCEALISYPDFRGEAAHKLVEAKKLHAGEIKVQRVNVLAAVKTKDYKRARIECYHLMQMVPDKQAKSYKDAEKLFKKLDNLK